MLHQLENKIGYGLRPLPEDKRDFPLGAVFKGVKIEDVPQTDFVVATPLKIKDQKDTDFCSAYAVTGVSEDQEGVELVPEFQFFHTKEITGDPEAWGADLRSACKSAVKVGSLPASAFKSTGEIPRERVLSKETWDNPAYAELAQKRRKATFWAVTGAYDTFDNIRCALWQHRDEKCTVVTGAMWRNEWVNAPGGVIQKEAYVGGFGHAFKLFGQKVIDGEIYLMAQLSNGTEIGDGGIFYFPRAVVNREIGRYGVYMFKDTSRDEAEALLNVKKPRTFNTILSFIINLFKK